MVNHGKIIIKTFNIENFKNSASDKHVQHKHTHYSPLHKNECRTMYFKHNNPKKTTFWKTQQFL